MMAIPFVSIFLESILCLEITSPFVSVGWIHQRSEEHAQKKKGWVLRPGIWFVEFLEQSKQITLKETGRGKYFRIVARVIADGMDVGEILLQKNLAVHYLGGRKIKDWCRDRVYHP